MADELNIPTHRWYQPRNNIPLAREDYSRQYIFDSGIQKIDAWIASQPWGDSDVYAVAGLSPSLVFDFDDEFYRTGGSTTTFDAAMTHTRSGNATMVDSDGVLKWGPHNLFLYSADLTNAVWPGLSFLITDNGDGSFTLNNNNSNVRYMSQSVTSSGDKTVIAIEAKAGTQQWIAIRTTGFSVDDFHWFDVSTGNVGSLGTYPQTIEETTDGFYLCQVEVDTSLDAAGSPRFYIGSDDETSAIGTVIARNPRAYRSDLGAMVDNPDTGNSYVPTTSAARYLPRRGHHIYNGTEWVNEGVLVESDPRTNLVTQSNNFSAATGTISQNEAGPDGVSNSAWTLENPDSNAARIDIDVTVATSTPHTFSIFAKAGTTEFIHISGVLFTSPANGSVWFDLSTGSVGTENTGFTGSIEDVGGGFYRCAITFTTDATDTSGRIRINLSKGIGQTTCDAGDNAIIYGAQLEAGSTPSSYIPTSGSTATRSADVITVPSANLPWPTPNVIGEELVTNGDFSSADLSDWSAVDATISVVDNELELSYSANTQYVYTSIPTVVGQTYVASWDVRSESSGSFGFVTYNNTFTPPTVVQDLSVGTLSSSSQTITYVFVAKSTTTVVAFYSAITSGSVYYDNISVREINPLAVSIQMDGTATGNTYTPTRWYLDANNAILQDIGSTDFTFTQEAAGVEDTVTGGSFTSGVNAPFNFASTHASTLLAAAVDGTALTDDTTPTALPDLSSTDLSLGYSFMGTLKQVRIWSENITEAGREEASS